MARITKKAIERAKEDLRIVEELYIQTKQRNKPLLLINSQKQLTAEQLGIWVEYQREHLERLLNEERLQKIKRIG
jgi:predicted ArsR family transcriptional regulator